VVVQDRNQIRDNPHAKLHNVTWDDKLGALSRETKFVFSFVCLLVHLDIVADGRILDVVEWWAEGIWLYLIQGLYILQSGETAH
jgi:hypothetical protein